jgi:hypothetical protein
MNVELGFGDGLGVEAVFRAGLQAEDVAGQMEGVDLAASP